MRNILLPIFLVLFALPLPVSASAESEITSRDYAELSVSQAYESGYEDGYFIGFDEGFYKGYESVESSWDDGYAEAENKHQELLNEKDRSAAYRGAFAVAFLSILIVASVVNHYKRRLSMVQYDLEVSKDQIAELKARIKLMSEEVVR